MRKQTCTCGAIEGKKTIMSDKVRVGITTEFNDDGVFKNNKALYLKNNFCPQCGMQYEIVDDNGSKEDMMSSLGESDMVGGGTADGCGMIILPGRPITKKNSQQIIYNRRTKKRQVVQSEYYRTYEESCLWHLKKYRVKYTGPVQVTARYWMPNRRSWPDLMGLLQATCDILEKAGIIENDRDVVSLNGSKIVGVDKENPRVEVEIKEVAEGEF